MECISLLGFSVCAPDAELRAALPVPAFDINREAVPPLLRRRGSLATQMAFSAATGACTQAACSSAEIPTVFASVAGEIQTTDLLCKELAKPDGVISPSAFHNSVQNAASGYWCIAEACTRASIALSANLDTFAMALLETWCQLDCHGGKVLLVCYDENWPAYLDPGRGEPAFAYALVLSAGVAEEGILRIGRPHPGRQAFPAAEAAMINAMPIMAALPLLRFAARGGEPEVVAISTSGWQVGLSAIRPACGG